VCRDSRAPALFRAGKVRKLTMTFLPVVFLGLSVASALAGEIPDRVVTFKVVVDEEFRHGHDARSVLPRLIGRVSDRFSRKFGIRFEVSRYDVWRSDNTRRNLFELLDDLRRKTSKDGCDVVLGVSAQDLTEGQYAGMASYMTGYVVLREPPYQALRSDVLEHELAHLFGAVDLREPGSIMDMSRLGEEYNDFLVRIIRQNRERSFDPYVFPLSESRRARAVELYRERKYRWGDEPDVNIMLALLYLEEKQYSAVERECREILDIRPDMPEVHSLLGISYRRQGRVDEAIVEYKIALHYHPYNPETHYNLGIALMKKGLTEEAVSEYERAIELLPGHARAYGNLGYVYLQRDQISQALAQCRRALDLYPDLPEVLSTLGAVLIRQGQYGDAEEVSRRALALAPKLAGPYINLGSVLLHRGEANQAIEAYHSALRLDPGSSEAHYNLGRAHLLTGQAGEAAAAFTRALEIDPEYHQASANLSAAYLNLERFEEAVAAGRRAVELKADYQVGCLNLARALSETGDLEEAETLCRRSLARIPENAVTHNLLGNILERQGKLEQALEAYTTAHESESGFVEPLINLGNLHFRLRQYPESSRHYLAAVALEPGHPEVHNNLAVIFYYREEYQRAWDYVLKTEALGLTVHADFKKNLRAKLKKECRAKGNGS